MSISCCTKPIKLRTHLDCNFVFILCTSIVGDLGRKKKKKKVSSQVVLDAGEEKKMFKKKNAQHMNASVSHHYWASILL